MSAWADEILGLTTMDKSALFGRRSNRVERSRRWPLNGSQHDTIVTFGCLITERHPLREDSGLIQEPGARSNPRAGAREDSREQLALGRVSLPAPDH